MRRTKEFKWVPPLNNLSRKDISRIWNCWTLPGDNDKVPRSDAKINWTYITHPKERRRQFLTDAIFYVCPRDTKLRSPDRERIISIQNPAIQGHDFTTEIGDYVVCILNHIRRRKGPISDLPKKKVFTEETLKISIEKHLQLLESNRLDSFMFFLAYVCKTCSSLTTNDQLDLMTLVIKEAETQMTYYSDKFRGFEELHKFASQKLIDGLETSDGVLKEFFIEPFR